MTFTLQLEKVAQAISRPEGNSLLFHPFSAEINSGSKIACVGASGQGKSSLLKIIALLDIPVAGMLSWNGQNCTSVEITEWRKLIHYVAQAAVMLPGTVADNLMLPGQLHNQPFKRDYAEQLLESCGLAHLDWQTSADKLSGGEKQRLALVRSLLLEPKVLLLDEVTSSLDERHAMLVERLLKAWLDESKGAYIWITHQPEQAQRIANELWRFKQHTITVEKAEVEG